MEFKERLLNELLDIARKRETLKKTLDNEKISDAEQVELLNRQFSIMSDYEEILFIRVLKLMK